MVYTTVADIQAFYIGLTFSTITRPSTAQVSEWIDEASAVIDTYLSTTYVVPITDSTDLLVIKDLCNQYVLNNCNFVLSKNRMGVVNNNEVLPRSLTHKEFFTRIEQICDKYMLTNTTQVAKHEVGYSYNADNNIVAKSNMTETLW